MRGYQKVACNLGHMMRNDKGKGGSSFAQPVDYLPRPSERLLG
jgi:hypothetical protein